MKKNLIKHESEINLAGINLSCFILEDGTRFLPKQSIQNALKMANEEELERYLNFISKDNHLKPVVCYKKNQKISGYEATRLIDICNGILETKKNLEPSIRQKIVDEQCKMLSRLLFVKDIIIVSIDKATGYQYEREKAELQAILKIFVSNEILKWQKTFHEDFYKQIFRLWNIPFTAEIIKKKPRFVGWLTNELIYKNMPENSFISDESSETLKKNGDSYSCKPQYQSLTPSGRETLKKVIYSVEALASISKNWNKFTRLIKEKYHPERELPFIDLEAMDSKEQETDFDQMLKVLLSTPPIRRKRE